MDTILEQFQKVTYIDIQQFFVDFDDFVQNSYGDIVAFYTTDAEIESSAFQDLTDLLDRSIQILSAFTIYKEQLGVNIDCWELLDLSEGIYIKLLTIKNSNRWLRSTKDATRNQDINQVKILKSFETIERVALDSGFGDPNNDWTQIAVKNELLESDYDLEGGQLLSLAFRNKAQRFVNTVIDSLQGEKIYGVDISDTFLFDNDDFVIVQYKENMNQSFSHLLSTTKGSVPEFPFDGLSKLNVSSNLASIQYPSIFRQISSLFQKDDRFQSFTLVKISQISDRVELEVQATTILEDTLQETISI